MLDLQLQYLPLLSLQMRQMYYAQDQSRDFDLRISPHSVALLPQLDWVFKQDKDQYLLLYNRANLIRLQWHLESLGSFSVFVQVYNNSPDAFSSTNWPMNKQIGHFFYQQINPFKAGEHSHELQTQDWVQEVNSLPIGAGEEYQEVYYNGQFHGAPASSINLTSGQGVVLNKDGQSTGQGYAGSAPNLKRPIGLIEIRFDAPTVEKMLKRLADDQPLNHSMNFFSIPTRKAIHKYLIVHDGHWKNLQLEDRQTKEKYLSEEINFEGKQATVISSQKALEVYFADDRVLALKGEASAGKGLRLVRAKMPKFRAEHVTVNREDGKVTVEAKMLIVL
ncbi:hypothetical protein [Persicobacter psychrovividus]|uniref:Uncharacterized protein n=1 Tax=Persicobacter psychrovividus TaxID=387638 RepID=A0ABM7VK20_9BACT|nr:hypothetical protein PEPS_36190 [Persicobacter psychrovividus]